MRKEAGFTIIENLVALVLVSIALVGSTAFFANASQSNTTSRTYSSIVTDTSLIIDNYRSNYNSLLNEFNTDYTAIANGQSTTTSQISARSRSTYTITLTAIKTKADSIPEAVRVNIAVNQRRGKKDDAQYVFETIIAQAN